MGINQRIYTTGHAKTVKKAPLYQCLECGQKFYSVRAAERAQSEGCSCGGCDIDLYVGGKHQ